MNLIFCLIFFGHYAIATVKSRKLCQNSNNVKYQKTMVTVPSQYRLPTAEDLPDSDEMPVDNELQNDIPNILLNLLREIWSDSPSGDTSRRSAGSNGSSAGL